MTQHHFSALVLLLSLTSCSLVTGIKAPKAKAAAVKAERRPELPAAACAKKTDATALVFGPLCAPFLSPGALEAHRAFREHAPDVLLAATVVIDAAGVDLHGNRPHLLALAVLYVDHLEAGALASRLAGMGVGAEAQAAFMKAAEVARAHVVRTAGTDPTVQALVQVLRDAAATRAAYWKQHEDGARALTEAEAELDAVVSTRRDSRDLNGKLTALRTKYFATCSLACAKDRLPVAVGHVLHRLHTATANLPAAMAEARWLASESAEAATYAEELVASMRAKVDATWSQNDRLRLHLPRGFDSGAPALDRHALKSYPQIDSNITSIKSITGNATHKQVMVAPTKERQTTVYRDKCRMVPTKLSHGPELVEECPTRNSVVLKEHPPLLVVNGEAAHLAVGERLVAFVDSASRVASVIEVTSPVTGTQSRNDARILQIRETRVPR